MVDSIVVQLIAVPRVRVVAEGDTVLCNGNGELKLAIQVDGPGYSTIVWSTGDTSDGLTITEPGAYALGAIIVPDDEDGCVLSVDTVRFTMRNYEPPTTTLELRSDTLWAQPAADEYQWYYENIAIAGWSKSWYVPSRAGTYRVTTRSRIYGRCPSESDVYSYNPTTVTEDVSLPLRATCSNGLLCVSGSRDGETLTLYSYTGAVADQWLATGVDECRAVATVARGLFILVGESGRVVGVVE